MRTITLDGVDIKFDGVTVATCSNEATAKHLMAMLRLSFLNEKRSKSMYCVVRVANDADTDAVKEKLRNDMAMLYGKEIARMGLTLIEVPIAPDEGPQFFKHYRSRIMVIDAEKAGL